MSFLRSSAAVAVALFSLSSVANAASLDFTVPGNSNPYLSGQPDGTTASRGDVAPDESPVLAAGLSISAGGAIRFPSVTGMVSYGVVASGPDGGAIFSHFPGAQNGISNVTAPINALLGVFVGDAAPASGSEPAALDFGTDPARDFATLSPELQQLFFIGDGRDSGGGVQSFVAPAGATRLFLGTMDGFGWFNNTGAFTVSAEDGTMGPVAAVPLPAAGWLLLGALGGLGLARRRGGA